MLKQKHNGFTIVELLIVIVVIGILAALTLNSFSGAQQKAAATKRDNDMTVLYKAIRAARVSTGKTLRDITNNGYSIGRCYAYTGANPDNTEPRDLPKTHTCWTTYYNDLAAIGTAANTNLDQLRDGDTRGNPYLFDENEGEISTNPCRIDQMFYFKGDGTATSVKWKDIPFYTATCL